MAWKDIEKQKEYHRNRYKNNKTLYQTRANESRIKRVKWLNDYKEKKGCSLCEEKHVACLDFHHTNEDQKNGNVTDFARKKVSMKRLVEEINKCQILCSNCHRKHHYNERINGSITQLAE